VLAGLNSRNLESFLTRLPPSHIVHRITTPENTPATMAVSENGSAIKQEDKEEKPLLNGNGRPAGPGPISKRQKPAPKNSFGAWAFNLLAK
jgi:hypothetical protein